MEKSNSLAEKPFIQSQMPQRPIARCRPRRRLPFTALEKPSSITSALEGFEKLTLGSSVTDQSQPQQTSSSLNGVSVPLHANSPGEPRQGIATAPVIALLEEGEIRYAHMSEFFDLRVDKEGDNVDDTSSPSIFDFQSPVVDTFDNEKQHMDVAGTRGVVPVRDKVARTTVHPASSEPKVNLNPTAPTDPDPHARYLKVRSFSGAPDPDYHRIKSRDANPAPPGLSQQLPKARNTETQRVRLQRPKATILSTPKAIQNTTPAAERPLSPPMKKLKLPPPSPEKRSADTRPVPTLTNGAAMQSSSSYIIPPTFNPYKYGRPNYSRSAPTPKPGPRESKPVYGGLHPPASELPSLEPRTVVISNLPPNPTLAMVSLVCRNTGKIETITLFESLRKARVAFVEAADARKLSTSSVRGAVGFEYVLDGQTVQHTAAVQMQRDVNFLSAQTRTLVAKHGASRVVRIVGWDRAGLERLVGAGQRDAGAEPEPCESLLVKLAGMYVYHSVDDRVEGATWRKNENGSMEACLVYSRIKDACCALLPLKREVELGQCCITYGKDPCEL